VCDTNFVKNIWIFVGKVGNNMTRPEKSLHILVKNPDSNLHFLVSPEIALHLITGRSGSGQC
jgi:hypothetical protein